MTDDVYLNASDADAMVEKARNWFQTQPGTLRLAVYGAGQDYRRLVDRVDGFRQRLIAVADDAGAAGSISLAAMLALRPDVVVAASFSQQELMRRRLRGLGYVDTVVLPYQNDPVLGSLGAWAYRHSGDWPAPAPQAAWRPPRRPSVIRDVLLVHPPFDHANHRHKKTMPLGLLYVAAYLRKVYPEVQVRVLDAHIARWTWDQMRAALDAQPFDLIGVTYWSAQARNAWQLSDHVRTVRPDAYVIHGGVHASLCPDEALSHCDAVVPYEGEIAFAELIRALNAGRAWADIPGVYCSGIPPQATPRFVDVLDRLPFPAWDLLPDVTLYDHPMHGVGGRRFPIMGSRGCPFNCSFCSSPLFWQRKVRWRSPANVVDEMDEIATRYGVEQFHFWDDNMVLNDAYARSLATELLARKRAYRWCGLSRASDLVRQAALLPLLKQAGCVGIEIGVESFADPVSAQLLKGESVASTEQAVATLHQAGIAPLYTHMLFTPGETMGSYADKEAFMRRVNQGTAASYRSDSALGQLTTPHVKTGFAQEADALGRVRWKTPSNSYHHRVNFIPFSLLKECPMRRADSAPDPLVFLTAIIQAVYDWTESDMRHYIQAADTAWSLLDGTKTVETLASDTATRLSIDLDKAQVYVALAVVGWSRAGVVASA